MDAVPDPSSGRVSKGELGILFTSQDVCIRSNAGRVNAGLFVSRQDQIKYRPRRGGMFLFNPSFGVERAESNWFASCLGFSNWIAGEQPCRQKEGEGRGKIGVVLWRAENVPLLRHYLVCPYFIVKSLS